MIAMGHHRPPHVSIKRFIVRYTRQNGQAGALSISPTLGRFFWERAQK